ncbi:hypothetical protein VYU27_003514 [Nannochloropsis oceanica]
MGCATARGSVVFVVLPLVLTSLLLHPSQARYSLSSSSSTSGPSIWGAILDEEPYLPFVGSGIKPSCRSSSSDASGMVTDSWLSSLEASLPTHRPQAYKWGPEMVEDNGGTVLALAGSDYCIIGADTRLSSDYRIRTRNVSRLMEVSSHTYMGMAGSWADSTALRREMAYDLSCFEAKHGRPIGTAALGTFLSNCLYLHRLQPMYALNLVAGLDDKGRGAIYSYDVIGSFNRVAAACCGRGQELMQPVLDQFTTEDRNQSVRQGCVPLSCEEALRVMKDAFLSGAEREISIGDGVEIVVLRKGHRPRVEKLKLPQH